MDENLKEIKETAQQLIDEEKYEKALVYIKENLPKNLIIHDDIMLIKSRLSRTKNQFAKGLIATADHNIALNQINFAIQELTNSLDEPPINIDHIRNWINPETNHPSSKNDEVILHLKAILIFLAIILALLGYVIFLLSQ